MSGHADLKQFVRNLSIRPVPIIPGLLRCLEMYCDHKNQPVGTSDATAAGSSKENTSE